MNLDIFGETFNWARFWCWMLLWRPFFCRLWWKAVLILIMFDPARFQGSLVPCCCLHIVLLLSSISLCSLLHADNFRLCPLFIIKHTMQIIHLTCGNQQNRQNLLLLLWHGKAFRKIHARVGPSIKLMDAIEGCFNVIISCASAQVQSTKWQTQCMLNCVARKMCAAKSAIHSICVFMNNKIFGLAEIKSEAVWQKFIFDFHMHAPQVDSLQMRRDKDSRSAHKLYTSYDKYCHDYDVYAEEITTTIQIFSSPSLAQITAAATTTTNMINHNDNTIWQCLSYWMEALSGWLVCRILYCAMHTHT